MKAIKLDVKGKWAQFRKAETNNNPLSHDFMTKTAFVGMMGAVLGIERKEMKELFPVLCDGILYGLQVNNSVKKQSWGFTLRKTKDYLEKAPGQMEFIKDPSYTIIIGLVDDKLSDLFTKFIEYCKLEKACYTPILGLHNCPANIEHKEDGTIELMNGKFKTYGFITDKYKFELDEDSSFRIGFDKIPTFQNNDFWNIPERYINLIYPSNQSKLISSGDYYEFNKQSQWCLI